MEMKGLALYELAAGNSIKVRETDGHAIFQQSPTASASGIVSACSGPWLKFSLIHCNRKYLRLSERSFP